MPSLKFDSSEVAKWADVLESAAGVRPEDARRVVAKGALQIKNHARRLRSGSRHLPGLTSAITYESHETPAVVWAEVGPEHGRRQGNLGHIPEFGTPTNAPEPYMRPAGEAERPRFERAMEDLSAKALER